FFGKVERARAFPGRIRTVPPGSARKDTAPMPAPVRARQPQPADGKGGGAPDRKAGATMRDVARGSADVQVCSARGIAASSRMHVRAGCSVAIGSFFGQRASVALVAVEV